MQINWMSIILASMISTIYDSPIQNQMTNILSYENQQTQKACSCKSQKHHSCNRSKKT